MKFIKRFELYLESVNNRKLDDLTKEKILKMEDYLNNNNISYGDIDNVFKEIWGII